jgi:hypothetical protein
MLWLLAAAILFLAWFAWQLFRPNPPIVISPETTHITEPLRPDGLPSYKQYFLTSRRAGVTPENNAAVPLWQALGPGEDSDALSTDDWHVLDRELSLGPPPAPDRVLKSIYNKELRAEVLIWLAANAPNWRRARQEDPAALAEIGLTQDDVDADEVIGLATDAPWRRDDLPPLADWVARNQAHLDSLVAAAKRPRFYSPPASSFVDENASIVETMTFPQLIQAREIARALKLRAMLHLGEGRTAEAWHDLLAIHRWARLITQAQFIIDQLVAIAVDGIACAGTNVLLSMGNLTPDLARDIQRQLADLAPSSRTAESMNFGERIYFLDATLAGKRKGMGKFLANDLSSREKKPFAFEILNFVSANWNTALVDGNRWHDQLAAICLLPTHSERLLSLNRLSGEFQQCEYRLSNPFAWIAGALSFSRRSKMLANRIIAAMTSSFPMFLLAEANGRTRLQLTQLAAALAVYRAEHGIYPEALEKLVPATIPSLPTDLYNGKPFLYQRDAAGYLLYSAGANGIDDGGSNDIYGTGILHGRDLPWNDDPATEKLRQQIPAGADDISIRLPTPPFKLPEPPGDP